MCEKKKEKTTLRIEGSFNDVLKVSLPKKKEDDKKEKKDKK